MEFKLIPENTKSVQKLKLTVLGKGMVGKSSLTYRFINYNTPTEHDATIEDKYKTVMDIGGVCCEIEILDTAGQDDYQGMLDMWINFAEGFLLVYAVNDQESFECLQKKRDRILKLKKDQKCPIVLVGNKCDLEKERVVTEADAKELARQWGASYVETSATANINCKESFQLLAKQIVKTGIKDREVRTGNRKCCDQCEIY